MIESCYWKEDLIVHAKTLLPVSAPPRWSERLAVKFDGSLTLAGTTYLVELKFTTSQADATDIDTFFKKVTSKADNTIGVMVSISGYSSVAKNEASGEAYLAANDFTA